jgi:general secretion pathway protein D
MSAVLRRMGLLALAGGLAACELPNSVAERGIMDEARPAFASQAPGGVQATPLAGGARRGGVVEVVGGGDQPGSVRRVVRGGRPLPVVSGNRQVRLDYTDVDVQRVLRDVVGDVLGLPLDIDPAVAGRVTLVTQGSIPIAEVPRRLDEALARIGFGIVAIGPRVRAGRIAELDALGAGREQETRIIPLAAVAPAEVIAAVQASLPEGISVAVAPGGRGVLVSGPLSGMAAAQELVQLFDTDILAGRSFALYPLAHAAPAAVARELQEIYSGARGLRILPMARANAILVVTDRPEDLQRVRRAVSRLDTAPEGVATLQVVPVVHRRAQDIADILGRTFGSGGGGGRPMGSPAGAFGALSMGASAGGSTGIDLRLPGGGPPAGGGAPGGPPGGAPVAPLPPGVAPADAVPANAPAPGPLPVWAELGFSAPVRIQADQQRNALLVLSSPVDFPTIAQAIRALDQRQRQIFIEAVIAEVSLSDNLRFGIDYSVSIGNSVLSQLAPVIDMSSGGFSYVLRGTSANGAIQALSSITDVRVVSAPRLLVLDNETATLQVGNQVPVLTQTAQSAQAAGAPIVSSVELRDTGVILAVRPRVGSGGAITLELFQEVSDAVTTDTSTINSPTIQLRRLQSSVAAQSGETVALGGLMRDRATRDRNGLPVAQDIPYLGALFGTRGQANLRTELLVLLTPRIVEEGNDTRALVDELRARLGSLAPDLARSVTPAAPAREGQREIPPPPSRSPRILPRGTLDPRSEVSLP